jgi:hypothetical protein
MAYPGLTELISAKENPHLAILAFEFYKLQKKHILAIAGDFELCRFTNMNAINAESPLKPYRRFPLNP